MARAKHLPQQSRKRTHHELDGKVFGELTVIGDDGERTNSGKTGGNVLWKCQCSCGKVTHVKGYNLTHGLITSCGHVQRSKVHEALAQDLARSPKGTRISLLGTKMSRNSTTGERNIMISNDRGKKSYRVAVVYKRHQYGTRHDTMAEALAEREHLRRKYWPGYAEEQDRSKKSRIKKNLVGMIFGELTVLEDDGTRTPKGSVKWLCQCSCGNQIHVDTTNLTHGRTKSCGHDRFKPLREWEQSHK